MQSVPGICLQSISISAADELQDYDLCFACEAKKAHTPEHTFTAYEKEYVQPELTPEQLKIQKERYVPPSCNLR